MSSAKPKRTRGSDTAQKYMDAAESLFIELGYEGTSIRAISARAEMNLATVVYHWGTKEALFRSVCERRFGEIQQEQVRRLKDADANWCEDRRANLDRVLRSLIEPPLLMPTDEKIAETTRLLYGRILTEPSEVVLRVTAEFFHEASLLLRPLVRRALPELDDKIFHWRYTAALGAFTFVQSFSDRISYAHRMKPWKIDWQEVADETVDFIIAGLLNRR